MSLNVLHSTIKPLKKLYINNSFVYCIIKCLFSVENGKYAISCKGSLVADQKMLTEDGP